MYSQPNFLKTAICYEFQRTAIKDWLNSFQVCTSNIQILQYKGSQSKELQKFNIYKMHSNFHLEFW